MQKMVVDEIRRKVRDIFMEETDGGRQHVWFRLHEDKIEFLDQRYLPFEEKWVECTDEKDVAESIRKMVLRGAPAIGIAAAFGVSLGVKKRKKRGEKVGEKEFLEIKETLLNTRPTAYNLEKALNDMEEEFRKSSEDELEDALERRAKEIWFEDFLSCYLIGMNGAELIPDGGTVFTICNTGALATGGWGTAFSSIKFAWKEGKRFEVIALETRPFLQGARLTAWELTREKINFRLIVDSSSTFLMKKIREETTKDACVIAGADRILRDGTTSNKIGTLMLAVSAKHFSIPFYVLAPTTTIDTKSEVIPIEERSADEVREVFGKKVAPENAPVYNFSFDITPPELISAIITDEGVFRYPYMFE